MMCTVGWKKHGCLDLTSTSMLKAMFYIFFTLALLCLSHSVSCFTAGMQEKKGRLLILIFYLATIDGMFCL